MSDALELTSNYFNAFEIVMLSVGIVAVILWIISMWRRGGQYTGKMHRLLAVAGIAAGIMGYMGLTNVAIENQVISIILVILHLLMKIMDSLTVLRQVCSIQGSISRQVTVRRP